MLGRARVGPGGPWGMRAPRSVTPRAKGPLGALAGLVCLGLRTIHASLIVPSRPPRGPCKCAAAQTAPALCWLFLEMAF